MAWHGATERERARTIGSVIIAVCLAAAGIAGLAACGGGTDSTPTRQVASDIVDIVATPQFDPAWGSFTEPRNIAITTATAGATIRYTLDGSTPNATSPAYVAPVSIAKTTTLQAVAFKSGSQPSGVQSVTYSMDIPPGTVAPVEFDPGSSDFSNDVTVSLSSQTEGATICYTLDGASPACSAGCCGGGSTRDAAHVPAEVTETGQRIRAVACKLGMDASSETHADYTLTVAAPTFDPAPGNLDPEVPVKVASATLGAEIHYRLDGARPNCHSPILENGTFPAPFTDDTTIRAIACKKNYAPSPVVDASYLGPACKGPLLAENRAQIEALGRCRTIDGSLEIRSVQDATDLAPLSRLQQINGRLTVRWSPGLRSLHGLESLTSVVGDVEVIGNDGLLSLSGLENLTSVRYNLDVIGNLVLPSLRGLDALKTVGTNMHVSNNPALTRIDGFPSLQTVGWTLSIMDNGATEWIGPASLTSLGGLSITREKNLVHVGGFPALKEIQGPLYVNDNAVLASFDELPALASIREKVTFSANPMLETFPAFANVRELGGLTVYSPRLTRLEAFKQVTSIHGNLSIGGALLRALDLSSVETVDGDFELYDLPALRSLEGLRGLTTVKGWSMRLLGDFGFASLRGLEHLTTVKGNLNITGGGLTELRGLDNLTTVKSLHVYQTKDLQSLRGLDKLARIEGEPGMSWTSSIEENAALTDIGSLNALTSVHTDIRISKNPKLTHLDGLHGLTSGPSIYLSANPALTKLDGLDALTEASTMSIVGNDALTTLEDLHALTRVHSDLIIKERSLSKLGMTSLTSIGGSLYVNDSVALPNLDGLDALHSVGIDLWIENNTALTRTDALLQLTSLGAGTSLHGSFNIRKNPNLPECQPAAIVALLKKNGYQGTVDISSNGTGTCDE